MTQTIHLISYELTFLDYDSSELFDLENLIKTTDGVY